MSIFSFLDIIESPPPPSPPLIIPITESSSSVFRRRYLPFFSNELQLQPLPSLHLCNPNPTFVFASSFPLSLIEEVPTDPTIRINNRFPSWWSPHAHISRVPNHGSDLCFGRVFHDTGDSGHRKYKWTAEIDDPKKKGSGGPRKIRWKAELKKEYTWTEEIRGGKKETCITCGGGAGKLSVRKGVRAVEIKEPQHQRTAVSQQNGNGKNGNGKRDGGIAKINRKRKVLSPQDAAMMIQKKFRAYLICRSQALRSLRELAKAKVKLKEIRALFSSFSYRRCISCNAEERQRFSERIIVILLTVDAIQGIDLMVRAARRSMLGELELMLNVIDPHHPSALGRRKFDLPGSGYRKEIADGVAEVVQMLHQDEKHDNDTFKACL